VFGHITDAIGIKRFTLRGKKKVDGQWKLMTLILTPFKCVDAMSGVMPILLA
jgi:hypothetical protein